MAKIKCDCKTAPISHRDDCQIYDSYGNYLNPNHTELFLKDYISSFKPDQLLVIEKLGITETYKVAHKKNIIFNSLNEKYDTFFFKEIYYEKEYLNRVIHYVFKHSIENEEYTFEFFSDFGTKELFGYYLYLPASYPNMTSKKQVVLYEEFAKGFATDRKLEIFKLIKDIINKKV